MGKRAEPPDVFLLACSDPAEAQARFSALEQSLKTILPLGVEIQHVGATAVPHCLTKGDLDICVRVTADAFAECDRALARHFSRNKESGRTEYFSGFSDPATNAGIQLVVTGSPLDVFTAFRDILRLSPELLAAYNGLKRHYHGAAMSEYRQAKDRFIETVLSHVLQGDKQP